VQYVFYGLRGRQIQVPPRAPHTLATPLSLPTNISKDAQQSSAPIKFPLHLWSTHVPVSFGSVENSVMPVTEKGFEERAATVFEKKSRQTVRQCW